MFLIFHNMLNLSKFGLGTSTATTSLVHLNLRPSSKDQILTVNLFLHGLRLPSTETCLELHTEWLLRWTRKVVTQHLHIQSMCFTAVPHVKRKIMP